MDKFEKIEDIFSFNKKQIENIKVEDGLSNEHKGTRYIVKNANTGKSIVFHIPFLNMGHGSLENNQIFFYTKDGFSNVSKHIKEFFDELEYKITIIKPELKSKISKNVKPFGDDSGIGFNCKLYTITDDTFKSKMITTKLFDDVGEAILPTDIRITNKKFKKTVFARIIIDSVYVTAEDKAYIQTKVSESIIYFEEDKPKLDLAKINSLRKNLKNLAI